jgi:hypothetical protein
MPLPEQRVYNRWRVALVSRIAVRIDRLEDGRNPTKHNNIAPPSLPEIPRPKNDFH